MNDPCAQIMPFPGFSDPKMFRPAVWQTRRTLDCRRNDTTDVGGFYVASNSIDFVHSETMADLGGAIVVSKAPNGKQMVTNHTKVKLTNVQVLRIEKDGDGKSASFAGLKDLQPGGSSEINFAAGMSAHLDSGRLLSRHVDTATGVIQEERTAPTRITFEIRGGTTTAVPAGQPSGELKLDKLATVALNPAELRPGEMRLVARTDAALDGFSTSPSPVSSDIRRATLIVVNLDAGKPADPEPDRKAISEAVNQQAENQFPSSNQANPFP
jgi:hypothetical protein